MKIIDSIQDINKFLFCRHTTHENQIDTPFIVGYWLKWFMTKLKPLDALRINNGLILRFLDKHVGEYFD